MVEIGLQPVVIILVMIVMIDSYSCDSNDSNSVIVKVYMHNGNDD